MRLSPATPVLRGWAIPRTSDSSAGSAWCDSPQSLSERGGIVPGERTVVQKTSMLVGSSPCELPCTCCYSSGCVLSDITARRTRRYTSTLYIRCTIRRVGYDTYG